MKESFTTINQFLTLLDTIFNAELSYFVIIDFDWFDGITQKLWNICLAKVDCSHESIVTENGHDTWNDWLCDSSSFTILYPLQVKLTIVK